MKTIFKTTIALLILSLLIINVYAGGMYRPGFFKWLKGDFEIPDVIKKVTSLSELQPFLTSEDSFVKVAAIRRLGEIEGAKAVGILSGYFTKETPLSDVGAHPLVKLEVVRTLGRIDTEQAKSALLGLLKRYWERGPVLPEKIKGDKGYFRMDRDFSYIVPELLGALYKWNSNDDVFGMAKTIALSDDVKNYYRGNIGNRTWEICIKGEMTRKGIVEEKDSAKYLLDYIEDIDPLHIDPMGLGPLKATAASAILDKHSEATLSSLVSEFEDQFEKEPRDSNGSLTEQHNILRQKIRILENILREKKEKREKTNEKAKKQEENPAPKN